MLLLNWVVEDFFRLTPSVQMFCIGGVFVLMWTMLLILAFSPDGARRLSRFASQLHQFSRVQRNSPPRPRSVRRSATRLRVDRYEGGEHEPTY